jgi:hypothetical protein
LALVVAIRNWTLSVRIESSPAAGNEYPGKLRLDYFWREMVVDLMQENKDLIGQCYKTANTYFPFYKNCKNYI